jgi:hypothetical protein
VLIAFAFAFLSVRGGPTPRACQRSLSLAPLTRCDSQLSSALRGAKSQGPNARFRSRRWLDATASFHLHFEGPTLTAPNARYRLRRWLDATASFHLHFEGPILTAPNARYRLAPLASSDYLLSGHLAGPFLLPI